MRITNNQSINNSSTSESDRRDSFKIVLAGNPNVGKSVFFNRFTGNYVEVSNFPGTTVDISSAFIDKNTEVIDTPGVYGISSYNDEEIVARNFIVKADRIVNVVNAFSLERDLFLTQQLIDLGIPMVIALNQIDEAEARGIKIDIPKLEELLQVKIFPTVAIKNTGISEIKDYILTQDITPSMFLTPAIQELLDKVDLTVNGRIKTILDYEENPENREIVYTSRREKVNSIISQTVSETSSGISLSTRIGNLLLNPVIGSITGIIVIYLLYKLIGEFVAGNVVDYLDKVVFSGVYIPWISNVIKSICSNSFVNEYLIGEFGFLTMAVKYIFGVILPLIFSFHLFMAVLEDSGYLPRLAVLTDRFLSKLGLNGRAVIPLILGFGCTTMATITTRILGSNRERTIATAMLGLAIPCSAQLGIIIGLIAAIGGLKAWIAYIVIMFVIFVTIGTVLNRLLPGKSSSLLIDLPPMRVPLIKNILKKTWSKSEHFLKEATPLFILGSAIITTLQLTNGIVYIQKLLEPFTVTVLQLPKETALVFLMGIIRRDFAAAGLAKMAGLNGNTPFLTPEQILTSLIVLTLFVPCIIAVTVLYKERGFKEASILWFSSWIIAFAVGGIVTRLLLLGSGWIL